ncbi:MAG TPA: cation:proton antiporter [Thermoanaerobaculia bacterium]|nr:cation:proton antiporter [Thermoanaerobaculia bacterium]
MDTVAMRQLNRSSLLSAAVYLATVAAAVLCFLWIRHQGAALVAPAPGGPGLAAGGPSAAAGAARGAGVAAGGPAAVGGSSAAASRGAGDALQHVLLALAVILVAARLAGLVFRRLGQPRVVGEVLAGILLGPSLLGRISPPALAFLLPPAVAPYLGIISQVGIILFMFLVGVELDPGLMRNRTQATVAISHASITVPFVLGALLALPLYPRLSTRDVPFTAFALFLGVSMSITAFPVLARILKDRGIQRTRLGVIALTCAAVDDVTAWCLLALVVSVIRSRSGSAVVTVLLTAAYIGLLLVVVRPLLARLVRRVDHRGMTQGVTTIAFVALLLSALITEAIGIHAIFGAFVLGVIVPHESRIARQLRAQLEGVVVVLLLPAFFAFTGLRTQVGLLRGVSGWLLCGLIVLVASLGKFGGSAVAARATGLSWHDAASLGVLMNTRGLVELIVLNIGLDLHVLSPALFAMLVLMAIATTMATTPLLALLQRGPGWEPAAEPAGAGVAVSQASG